MKVLVCAFLLCIGRSVAWQTRDLCLNISSHPCETADVRTTLSFSGGGCYSVVLLTGVERTAALNPIMKPLLKQGSDGSSDIPFATVTASGGTLYAMRAMVLRDDSPQTKFSYPCYFLAGSMAELCYFHQLFGRLAQECLAEHFNTLSAAYTLIYGSVISAYGGPFGVASNFASTWFPYMADLPIPKDCLANVGAFAVKYLMYNPMWKVVSNWIVSVSIVNPVEASDGMTPYNYGFQSYLSRGIPLVWYETGTSGFCANCMWYSNMTLGKLVSASTNLQGGFPIFPFAFAGKPWDNEEGNMQGVGLKLFGMLVSFIMVKRMLMTRMLRDMGGPRCAQGCPVLDSAFTDAGPLTTNLAYCSLFDHPHRPTNIFLYGPASTFSLYKFLGGAAPMDVWTSGCGVNLCPWTNVAICGMINTIRGMMVSVLPAKGSEHYWNLRNAFGVYLPENQVITPYCGDPLAYDKFQGDCQIASLCSMESQVLPNQKEQILGSSDIFVVIFTVIYLDSTPLSHHFVYSYIPQKMIQISYYSQMSDWFPNFSFMAKGKGGFGWTTSAGNALMDYLTYLTLRLAEEYIRIQQTALELWLGIQPNCPWLFYKEVEAYNIGPQFMGTAAQISKTTD